MTRPRARIHWGALLPRWRKSYHSRECSEIITLKRITTNLDATNSAGTGPGAPATLGHTLFAGVASWLAARGGAAPLEINRVVLRHDHSEISAVEFLRDGALRYHRRVRIRVESCDLSSILAARLRDFDQFELRARYRGRAATCFPECRDPDATFRELNDRLLADVTSDAAPPEDGEKIVVDMLTNSMLITRNQVDAWRPLPGWWLSFQRRIAPRTESRDVSLSATIRWPSGHRRAELARMNVNRH
jgi:hypothetical protein